MTENQSAENPRLMSMASAISDGIPINWGQAEETPKRPGRRGVSIRMGRDAARSRRGAYP